MPLSMALNKGTSLEGERAKGNLLDIDLNVAPPEDEGSESPAAADGVIVGPAGEEGVDYRAHWSKRGANGFAAAEEEESKSNIAADEEKERRNRRWSALLEVSESYSRPEPEEQLQNRKRKASRQPGGEVRKQVAREKIPAQQRQSLIEFAAPQVVARSTRGRAVAMPNKYRDSVLHAVAEYRTR